MNEQSPATNAIQSSWRVPAIDGVRALAMLMVYTYHMWQFGGSPRNHVNLFGFQANWLGMFPTFPAGVDLFMVLSGFCLFLPLCKSDEAVRNWNLKEYAIRRLRRITPPYYAAIAYVVLLPQLLTFLFHLLHLRANPQIIPTAWQFVTHIFFIHTLFVDTWDGINSSFWSLGLEAQFYAVFPLVVYGFRRYGTRFFWLMIALSLVYRIAVPFIFPSASVWPDGFVYSIFFLGRWMQFALGAMAAYIVSQHWKSGTRRSSFSGTMAILCSVLVYAIATSPFITSIHSFPLRDLLLGVCFSTLIMAVCVSTTPLRAIFEWKPITWLGFISYSFFLIHEPTAFYMAQFMKKKLHLGGDFIFIFLCSVGFLLVVAVAYIFFLLFEKPFLSTRPKINPRSRASTPILKADTATIQDQAIL